MHGPGGANRSPAAIAVMMRWRLTHPGARVIHRTPRKAPLTQRIKIGITMTSGNTVSAELGLRLVVAGQAIIPLAGSLSYSRDDPYAVRMAIHVGLDEPVVWVFARDLLRSGGGP